MMLHQKFERKALLYFSILIVFSSVIEFFYTPIFSYASIEENTALFIGILLQKILVFVIPGGCLKILLGRMGFDINIKKITSILIITLFLPFIITPIFHATFLGYEPIEMGFILKAAIEKINIAFWVCGLIYFIQALRKEIKINFRRAFFITIFTLIMTGVILSPFYTGILI